MRRRPSPLVSGLLSCAVVAAALAGCSSDAPKTVATSVGGPTTSTLPAAEPEGTVTYTGLSRNHVDTPVQYPQTPPVGGNHWPVWETCAFYTKPIQTEQGVHSMEHGAVWITYSPDLPAAQIAALQGLEPSKQYLLITPFDGLPAKVVATAWGKQLLLDSVDDPRLLQFVAFFEHGPQTPEQGVPCQQGSDATL